MQSVVADSKIDPLRTKQIFIIQNLIKKLLLFRMKYIIDSFHYVNISL